MKIEDLNKAIRLPIVFGIVTSIVVYSLGYMFSQFLYAYELARQLLASPDIFFVFQFLFPIGFCTALALLITLIFLTRGPGWTVLSLRVFKGQLPIWVNWADNTSEIICVKREGNLFRWKNHYLIPPKAASDKPALNARHIWKSMGKPFYYLNVGDAKLFTADILEKLSEENKKYLGKHKIDPKTVKPGTEIHETEYFMPKTMTAITNQLYPQSEVDEIEYHARNNERKKQGRDWTKIAAFSVMGIMMIMLILILIAPSLTK